MNPKVGLLLKLALWVVAVTGGALILRGTSSASDLHPVPPRPSPPGKDEMAIGTFQCSQSTGGDGFSFLQFRGTAGIDSPFLQGQFSTAPGTATPVTCQSLAQQVAADATAGGCTVGPVADVESDFGDPATTVHFVCSGGHDAVVAAIGRISSSMAAATTSTPLD